MASDFMSSLEDCARPLVEGLILEEQRLSEQRAFHRIPFCRPVTITAVKRDGLHANVRRVQWSALTRDISMVGVGLLSKVRVKPGSMIILTIPQRLGTPVILKVEMKWCEPFCDGLYVMGGRLLEAIESPWERLDVVI